MLFVAFTSAYIVRQGPADVSIRTPTPWCTTGSPFRCRPLLFLINTIVLLPAA
jgi:hypothetical protein